jgi:glycerol-3-phosphate dehydrogenase
MKVTRQNARFLPDCHFPDTLHPIASLEDCVPQVNDIVAVVPSHAFRETLSKIVPYITAQTRLCWSTKGLEKNTGLLLHKVAEQVLGPKLPLAVLSGPSCSALITRGLTEMVRFGTALGGQGETFMGLAGLGDLILTCTDNQSRNRRFGYALAQGSDQGQAQTEIGQVVEGKRTTREVNRLARQLGIDMPIVEQVDNVLQGVCTPNEAVQALLSRQPKPEFSN